MSTPHYQIIRRPIITEKGLGVKEIHGTVVFEVSAKATKTQIKEAVQQIFKVKVAGVRTANFYGKMRRRGQTEGYRRDWKKAYVKLAEGEKNDRVCGEFVVGFQGLYYNPEGKKAVTSGRCMPPRDEQGKRQRWD